MKILIGPTRCMFECSKDGRIPGTSVNIFVFLKRYLVEYEFDQRSKRWKIGCKYFKYTNGVLFVHIKFLPLIERYLSSITVERQFVEVSDGDDVQFKLSGTYTDREHQVDMIKFLCSGSSMRALEMQTGKGKTYCAIKSMSKIGKRTLIIVPANLIDQWYNELTKILKLPESSVAILKGSQSILDLERFDTKPQVLLASLTTLSNLISTSSETDQPDTLQSIMSNLGVGLKIIDECHKNFRSNLMVDLSLDIYVNIYLSATYLRTNKDSHRIFTTVFDRSVKYEIDGYDNYINVTECQYHLRKMHDKRVSTVRGYSQIKFEKQILTHRYLRDHLFDDVIVNLVNDYYLSDRQDGYKLLILVGLKDFAYELSDFLNEEFDGKGLNIQPYLAEHSDDVLVEADIIVSTTGSCGTGKDIKGLSAMILFVSFGSKPLTYQTIGRLRKMPDGTTPEFVYMVCSDLGAHVRHAEGRRQIYKMLSNEYKLIRV